MLQFVATGGAYRLYHRGDILDFSTADLDRKRKENVLSHVHRQSIRLYNQTRAERVIIISNASCL